MTAVVLVHGAWHDGRCWDPLVRELSARGHRAVAVDLPSAQPGLGCLDYAAVVEAAVAEAAEPCVLVGHSLGGLTVPVVAQRLGPRRVVALMLVAALVPEPGRSFDDQVRADPGVMAPGFGRGQRRHGDRTTSWPVDAAKAGLYRGVAEESSPEVVDAAVATLRPQAWTIGREVTPLSCWPEVPTTVVVCADDLVVAPDRLRMRARSLVGAGVDPDVGVVELAGGHFPMLTRPGELAAVISEVIAAAPPAGHADGGHRER
jgi:pimeloyl-ACP methyl ester carboxylesterase